MMVNYNDSGTYRLRTYSDGVWTNLETYSGSTTTDGDIFIGSYSLHRWANYSGLMDDLRIYNRALNESEILDLYNAEQ